MDLINYVLCKKLIEQSGCADMSKYYTKDEINELISSISNFNIEIVTSLPTTNISNNTIYLVKKNDDPSNLYVEYIYVEGHWEILGSQVIDLTGYATQDWVSKNLAEQIVDNLLSTDGSKILSARMGKELNEKKQDKLIPGANVSIVDNVISFSGEGGSGTTDYEVLTNKPSINGVELKGNLTDKDLNLVSQDKNFVFVQNELTNEWIITHNLQKYPSVIIFDEKGNEIIGDVQYLNMNKVIVNFNIKVKGSAILN